MPFHPALLIPLALIGFAGLWLAITGLLGLMSGWFRLQRAFPDRREDPVVSLRFESGLLGAGMLSAHFGNCLAFDLCPTGLRIAVLRLLGPFSRPFFVPWSQIEARRRKVLFGEMVELSFGVPSVGKMLVRLPTANRLAQTGFLCAAAKL